MTHALCLATSYTSDFADIGSYCAVGLPLYAARFGADVHVETSIELERPPSWHRVQLIPKLFDRGHEFVLWADADSIFQRFDVNILSEVEDGKDLYLVQHVHPDYPASPVPNTGVMLLRNTTWSRDLLARLWSLTEYKNHAWWDNAAMIDLLGYHALLGKGPHAPNEEILNRVKFMPEDWNHIPQLSLGSRPIIRHYAGVTNDIRRVEMPRDAVKAALATINKHETLKPAQGYGARLLGILKN